MKKLVILFGVAALAWLASPMEAATQEPVCWLCTEYDVGEPPNAETWHFWPEWGGVVCDGETGNEDCDLRPSEEDASDMPGYEGDCPNRGCEPSQENEELLAHAVATDDVDAIVSMLRAPTGFDLNPERGAIQATTCSGAVVIHLPLSESAFREVSVALEAAS